LGAAFAAASAVPPASASFNMPHSPLGSAAVTAMPVTATLSRTLVHSSGVKLALFAIAGLLN
jgi:hypothetical protein